MATEETTEERDERRKTYLKELAEKGQYITCMGDKTLYKPHVREDDSEAINPIIGFKYSDFPLGYIDEGDDESDKKILEKLNNATEEQLRLEKLLVERCISCTPPMQEDSNISCEGCEACNPYGWSWKMLKEFQGDPLLPRCTRCHKIDPYGKGGSFSLDLGFVCGKCE